LASDHTQQDDQQQTGSNAKGGEESNSHNASFTLDAQFARKSLANQGSIKQLSDRICFSCNSIGVRAAQQLWRNEIHGNTISRQPAGETVRRFRASDVSGVG